MRSRCGVQALSSSARPVSGCGRPPRPSMTKSTIFVSASWAIWRARSKSMRFRLCGIARPRRYTLTMPQKPPRIAVIGAGIAGLTAAYTLQKRGFAVQVFEREDTPGGRMRSEQRGDFVIERGAQFIASSYRDMRALAAELGIADSVEPLA